MQQRGGAEVCELVCMDAHLYCAVRRTSSHSGIHMDRGAFLRVWACALCAHNRRCMYPCVLMHEGVGAGRGGGEREREREKVY